MSSHDSSSRRFRAHLSFILMVVLLIILWLSGGASRGDVIGQALVRAASWAILVALILFGKPPQLRLVTPVVTFLLAAMFLLALQLIPLPPWIWTALPGRDLLEQAAVIAGREQPWRALSISPSATLNAFSSLIVPVVTVLLMAHFDESKRWRIAVLLLALVIASSLLGLLQFSGGRFDHPLINDVPTSVSASFANRNHFALFVAVGCVLAPAWAFREQSRARWKGPVAICLMLLFTLVILATGSRTGILLGVLGSSLGLLSVRQGIAAELRSLPRPVAIGVSVVSVVVLTAAVILSVTLGRALALDRALSLDSAEDLRRQALPVIWGMIVLYFPFGSGFGTFDAAYRIHEPDRLLGIGYLNHVHNDFLEVLLDGGLPGLMMIAIALAWWLWRSVKVWRSSSSTELLPRLGSSIFLLVLTASITDYPARTPMIMSVIAISAIWLNRGGGEATDGTPKFPRRSITR